MPERSVRAEEPRAALARAAATYMRQNLRVEPSPEAASLVAEDPKARLVEFAHTPHFGHLGFFRMLATACHLTVDGPDRVMVLLLNDHVRANAFRFIRHIPMSRAGKPMKALPALGVPGPDASTPLRYVPAPGDDALARAHDLVLQVMLYEASNQHGVVASSVKRSVDALFEWLGAQARQVHVFSEWVARCLLLLLQGIWGANVKVLVVPSSALSGIFAGYVSLAVERRSELARIQNEYGKDGEWPSWSDTKVASPDFLPVHVMCPSCRRVAPTEVTTEDQVSVSCHGETRLLDTFDDDVAPKVVLRQPLADLLGLEYRVCGNPLGYWDVADAISEQVFNLKPATRYRVGGYVSFDGLGGEESVPAMLRVLAEMNEREIASQILARAPSDDMVVISPRLAGSNAY